MKDINVYKNAVEINATSFNVLMASVLAKNTKLQRFCKFKVEDGHKLEAFYLGQFNWEREEEKKRIEAEKAKENEEE